MLSRGQPYDLSIWDDHKKVFLVSWSEGDAEFWVTTCKKGACTDRQKAASLEAA
jgi:hypothetical protein